MNMKTISILAFLLSCVLAQEYCNMSSCKGKPHIGCGTQQNVCPDVTEIKVFNKAEKTIILNMHNKLRNALAGGKISNRKGEKFDPAARMATMKWDAELEKLCALNVKRCIYGHDKCRKTKKFPYAGQNLAKFESTVPYDITDISPVKKAIQLWFNEHKDCNMEYIKKFPNTNAVKDIGHFTGMVGDNNIASGCAALQLASGKRYTYLLCCNYAMTNIVGNAIYESGKAGSGCNNTNPKYTNLCDVSEIYSFP